MSMHEPNSHSTLGTTYPPLDNKSTGVFYFWRNRCLVVFLCVAVGLISLSSTSCEEKISTPDWSSTPTHKQAESNNLATPASPDTAPKANIRAHNSANEDSSPLRFVCYNLRNYLTMRRGKEEKFKPEHEVKAIIDNIIRANPDILGVCEIGNQADLEHLQTRLSNAGCHLPHIYLSIGADPYRRQALLSRYPIQSHDVPNYTYQMKGKRHQVRRGILDATIQTPKGDIRFLGAHLKSKRPIAVYDQAEIRREEAHVLRKHASKILSNPTYRLLVFGDMNDTKGSSTIRLMYGSHERKLTPIDLSDKHGTKWTQYWAKEDIYSRFDYVLASRSILPMIDQASSYILDIPAGDPASDHRALVIVIR